MRGGTLLLSAGLFAFGTASSLACTHSDYLLTLENYAPAFEEYLAASEQDVGDLDGHIVEAAYPVCDRDDLFNFVYFYVADGAVRLVGNSVTFGAAGDAEAYYSEVLEYLSADFDLAEVRTVQGEGGVISERHASLSSQSEGLTLNLAMVTEYDFGEYAVYLESYAGAGHPLLEEAQ